MIPTLELTGKDDGGSDGGDDDGTIKCREHPGPCIDENASGCPRVASDGQCYENHMLSYTFNYWRKSCGFCGGDGKANLVGDCEGRVKERGCRDVLTQGLCPAVCCTGDRKDDEEKEDGGECPNGLTLCPDGQCKHVHMC